MIFGVLKDIKEGENRVICTPVEIASIAAAGHKVLVQQATQFTEWNTTQRLKNGLVGKIWVQQRKLQNPGPINLLKKV